MGLTVEIPSDVDERLARLADQHHMAKEQYAAQLIEKGVTSESGDVDDDLPKTGAELVERWKRLGLIGDWADRDDITDSSAYARQLREKAQTRDWD